MQFQVLVNNLSLLGLIAIALLILVMLFGIIRGSGRSRTLALLGFLGFLSAAIGWVVVGFVRTGVINLADWALWGRYIDFGTRGIWLFLLAAYAIILGFPDFLRERKWAIIVVLIGPIIYEILMYGTFSISSDIYETAWLVTGLILAIMYMLVIPLFATLRYVKQDGIRGTPQVKWIWVVLLGVLIWFFGELVLGASQLLQLPGWNSFFGEIGLMIVSAHVFGWWIILVGYILQMRAIQSGSS
ncbi:MAG: hypothetical protein ACFE7R_00255 [Candidatus Hodarchaeota archaeon]